PTTIAFESPISDTDFRDPNEKPDHNPLHKAANYLKNAITLEAKSDEKRRESVIADHAHVNDYGGAQAEAEFWGKHGKHHGPHEHGQGHVDHGHERVEATNKPVTHVNANNNEKARTGGPVTGTLL
ncbi:hypothetical protein BDU57DRAFT_454000, partial [Ampelomyces quisqualis]